MEAEKTQSRVYLEDTSVKLIDKYRDVIEKTFEICDKDLLQDEIDGEDENQKESRLLDALKKRRLSLDEVDIMLEKIDKIEQRINPNSNEEGNNTEGQKSSWAKKKAAESKAK
jgi:hypothetical protein